MAKKRANNSPATVDLSVVIPAYKEVGNLQPLIERISATLSSKNFEIIVVDDNSQDGSEELVEKLSSKYPARIIVRTTERGLSSAVLRGFEEAKGDLLICMDADLQHPPEKLGEMFEALESSEFVIGTRYAGQNSVDKDWPLYRRVISSGARMLAMPLTPLSDPMTGFFGIKRSVLDKGKNISPIGFKICMELFVKCGVKKHTEVPIYFGVRLAGESKLSSKVIINYIKHLIDLYLYKFPFSLALLFLIFIASAYYLIQNLELV